MKNVFAVWQIIGDPDDVTTFRLIRLHSTREGALRTVSADNGKLVDETDRESYFKSHYFSDWECHNCFDEQHPYPAVYLIEVLTVWS